MIDHRNFALNGLFPGLVTTRSVANLGAFEVQVIIEPVQDLGGGGYSYHPYSPQLDKYKIRIIVTRKNKKWEYETIVGSTTAKIAARILNKKVAEPSIKVVTNIRDSEQPTVKVTVK